MKKETEMNAGGLPAAGEFTGRCRRAGRLAGEAMAIRSTIRGEVLQALDRAAELLDGPLALGRGVPAAFADLWCRDTEPPASEYTSAGRVTGFQGGDEGAQALTEGWEGAADGRGRFAHCTSAMTDTDLSVLYEAVREALDAR